MKTPGTILVSLFAALVLAACSTVDVTTDYDHAAPFGTYKTYSLAPAPDGEKLPIHSERALRNSIRTALAARGVAESAGPNADLAIVWHVFLSDSASARKPPDLDAPTNWAYEYGVYGLWADAPGYYGNTTPYPDGTLILDVVDMRTKKLVFRGTGTAAAMGPERGAKNIQKAVTKMVEALPTKR